MVEHLTPNPNMEASNPPPWYQGESKWNKKDDIGMTILFTIPVNILKC
jgi:hypothetical protein